MKARKTFHISEKPIVPLVEDEDFYDLADDLELRRFFGSPRLRGIARDPRTIFAYWNVHWASIFKDVTPIDRQVHLRTHCADGLEEKEVAVEPMSGMHYVALSQRHRACRIEIGYYQPADVWHSVAMSSEIMIPANEPSEAEHVDLAAIPLHLNFQELTDLFGTEGNGAVATAISRFQTHAISAGDEKLRYEERKILRRTGVAVSELANARRAFNQLDVKQLQNRARTYLGSGSTSPSRGFRSDWTSGGS